MSIYKASMENTRKKKSTTLPDTVTRISHCDSGPGFQSGSGRMIPGAATMKLRTASWNVGSMNCKSLELEKIMNLRNIDILCIQETRWKNLAKKSRFLDLKTKQFKLFYYGTSQGRNGVGVIMKKCLCERLVEIQYVNDRIINLKVVLNDKILNVISAYAPQQGTSQEEKNEFWQNMENTLQNIPSNELILIGADFNGHVGCSNDGYEGCHGGYGFGARNAEGETLLNFCGQFQMTIMNTWFQKAEKHLITYKSGPSTSQIDFILCRNDMRNLMKDCKVILGEELVSQHRLLIAEFRFEGMNNKQPRIKKPEKIKWFKLSDNEELLSALREFLTDIVNASEDMEIDEIWNAFEEACIMLAKLHLGTSKGSLNIKKESWWWNESVAKAIQNKKRAFKEWSTYQGNDDSKRQDLHKEYKLQRKLSKIEVAKAMKSASEELYQDLETTRDPSRIYKIASQRKFNAKDISNPKYIMNEDGQLLTSDDQICNRWKEYYEDLLNKENPITAQMNSPSIQVDINDISSDEIIAAIRKMKNGKAAGPDGIPAEVWKLVGDPGVEFLLMLFNKMLRQKRIPLSFRHSFLLPFYKNKGDSRLCNNHRALKLMAHTFKAYERVIDQRIRGIVQIHPNQCGFVEGKSTTEAIQATRILIEKHRDKNRDFHAIFIDLEKAFDRVPRRLIWEALRAHAVPEDYVEVIQDMYHDITTSIRCSAGTSERFSIEVGVHQGSVLSPLLFNIVMNYLTRDILDHSDVQMMLFADDIVILSDDIVVLQDALNALQYSLESSGLKISRTKTEYMYFPFKDEEAPTPSIYIQEDLVPACQSFNYLGSRISTKATCEDDVIHRIQIGWMKWHELSGILCDKRMPKRLKGIIHKTCIRTAMLFGSQCWTMKKQYESKINAAEMKMLRMSSGITKLDKFRNEDIREGLGINEAICDKIEEFQMKWYGHVQRRKDDEAYLVTQAINTQIHTTQPPKRGRKPNTWLKQMQKKLEAHNIREDIIQDRGRYRFRIHTRTRNADSS